MTTKTLKTQHKLVIKHKGKYQLIACLDGREVGYLLFKFEVAEVKNRAILLDWMEVNPKFQGLGVGKALMRAFLKEIKEKYPTVVMISLWTSKELEEAGRGDFYEQFGFKKMAVRRDFYAPGVHCRLYAKRVASGKIVTMRDVARKLRASKRRKKEAAQMSKKSTQVTKKVKKMSPKRVQITAKVRVPAYANVKR